jgi:hypothetical protein
MMTILQRIIRAVKSSGGLNQNLENYYSNLLSTRVGDSGLPSATEARRDLEAVWRKPTYL